MDEAAFEAPDDGAAKAEAQRRANHLSPLHFVTLLNEAGNMIWATEPANS